ncbi:MAG: hypothetical protein WC716_16505 [Chitinophagaceae bacterium]
MIDYLISGGIALIASGGVSYGYIKGKLSSMVNWPEHREICHEKSNEINITFKEIQNLHLEMMKAIGRIEGKLEERGK